MTTKMKCKVCSKAFEAVRSDSKYCSPACKQKAHYDRNKIATMQAETPMTFYFSEYEAVIKECYMAYEDMPFVLYGFFRKNLRGNPSINTISNYVASLWFDKSEIMKLKSFQEFQEEFLKGLGTVSLTKAD